MRLIADLHIHSKYSRAVSRSMDLKQIAAFALKKGIGLVGTGDFTHPEWVKLMERDLEETGDGFAVLKGTSEPRFVYTCEIACIYGKGGKTRRIHQVMVAPDLKTVKTINARLSQIGNLKADGRPILGCDAKEIVKIVRESNPHGFVIPAHVWTPWFSVYGSMSGFDSLEECYEEEAKYITTIETGLSSDPPMNWRMQQLDGRQIVSFSDAHSAQKMGREATILELSKPTYANFRTALTAPDDNRIAATIEFFPEEGKYHWDGHRSHNLRWSPEETKKHGGICTACHRPVTVGVLNRVDQIADRPDGFRPDNRPPYHSLIPLNEIIADALGVGVGAKKVAAEYDALINALGTEFRALTDATADEIKNVTQPRIAEGILRVRQGKVHIVPGYDGVYGTVEVFSDQERTMTGQATLL